MEWFKSKNKSKDVPKSETFELFGTLQPQESSQTQGPIQNQGATQTQGTIQTQGAILDGKDVKTEGGIIPKFTTWPRNNFTNRPITMEPIWRDTKLTVILVENTEEVAKQKDILEKIVKNFITIGYVCVINYGSLIRESKIVEAKEFDSSKLLCDIDIGDSACLYDALVALKKVVDKSYKKVNFLGNRQMKISSLDIIGIGRCFDNCSIYSSETAIESFCSIASNADIVTKYFCLSEKEFLRAATIGFHSIGAISRNYM